MPLTREQKSSAVDSIVDLLKSTPTIYLTNYQGLNVAQSTELRDLFRAQGVQYKVFKNTLLKRAMEEVGGYEGLFDELNGPTAVAFSVEPATPAKVMKQFSKSANTELPALKAAFVDGAVYHADALDVLAALKSKDEIIGDVIGLLLSPMTNVSSALSSAGSNILALVKAIEEKAAA
ncbi:MAG: 50S ribosomal protein L10 [Bacteroidetes bacterium]|nr:50S ribosomal protein L10 [Bacteroidota bacterium]